MAASLADRALEDGLSVGLCVWSNDWVGITPGAGRTTAKTYCRYSPAFR